jgi:hypothetical protein
MNSTLAALYGTGMNKVANAEETDGDFDLSQLSDEELLGLMGELGVDEDPSDDDTLQKMASEGEIEYWDMAGRIMAHAYADEFDKVAGSVDGAGEDYLDLNEFSEEEIILLGQELEKEASMRSRLGALMKRVGRAPKAAPAQAPPPMTAVQKMRARMGAMGERANAAAGSAGGSIRAKLPASVRAKAQGMSDRDLAAVAAAATGATAMAGGGGAMMLANRRRGQS